MDENCTSVEINSLTVCNVSDNPNNDEYNDGSTLSSKDESFKTQSYSATKDSSANNNFPVLGFIANSAPGRFSIIDSGIAL